MPGKQKLLQQVIAGLDADLAALEHAAKEARDYATDKDSKAESKYDTRGLEASYLAGAQAEKALELREAIASLRSFHLPNLPTEAAPGTVVIVTSDHGIDEAYFILPAGGGIELDWQEQTLTVISHQSPRAKSLLGKLPGNTLDEGGFISEIW